MIYDITPVAKPRMTRSDKWKKRPCVLAYRAFKDECRLKGVMLNNSAVHITFYLPMPKSWSKKKKELHNGRKHQQRPDLDNIAKALADALFIEDSHIWDERITKRWAYRGAIMINEIEPLPEVEILT